MSPPSDQGDYLLRRHSDFSSLKVDSIQTPRYGDGYFEECRVPLQLRKVQAGSIANISVSGVGLGCNTHESISSPGQERSIFSNGIKNDSVSRSQSFGCNDPAGKIKFCVNGSSTGSSSFTSNTNANIVEGPRPNLNEFKGTSILRSGKLLALVELASKKRHPLPDQVLATDASLSGWGAWLGNLSIHDSSSKEDQTHHIHFRELMTVYDAICHWRLELSNQIIVLQFDNTTAVAFLLKEGGYTINETMQMSIKDPNIVRISEYRHTSQLLTRLYEYGGKCAVSTSGSVRMDA